MQDWRVEFLRQNNFPFVMFGHCEDNTGLSYVDFDIEAGVKMAMEHLVGLGHRQIGFVSAEPFCIYREQNLTVGMDTPTGRWKAIRMLASSMGCR